MFSNNRSQGSQVSASSAEALGLAVSQKAAQELAVSQKKAEEPDDSVHLKAAHSGLCLSVTAEGAWQEVCQDKAAQRFKLVANQDDDLAVVALATGHCLDVAASSKKDGALLRTVACKPNKRNQLWEQARGAEGLVTLRGVDSGKCLDVLERSKDDGATVSQWECNGGRHQAWQLVAAADGSGQPATIDKIPSEPSVGDSLASVALSCSKTPKVETLETKPWTVGFYGTNYWYSDFFTPIAEHEGSIYWVWVDSNMQPRVSKVSASGEILEEVELAANYRVRKDHHHLFSLGIDKEGYIHISGDMQNGPYARDKSSYPSDYVTARILYWKSKQPKTLAKGFEFLGNDAERAIPASSVNGIRFFSDNHGELFASAAVNAVSFRSGNHSGLKGVGLYRYLPASASWEALGGEADKSEIPPVKQSRPVLFWEVGGQVAQDGDTWFQGFFSYFRFDHRNRLHFATSVNTDRGEDHNMLVYAASDDKGKSWKRADGKAIGGLPLRATDELGESDLIAKGDFHWQSTLTFDGQGRPAVGVNLTKGSNEYAWFTHDGKNWNQTNTVSKLEKATQGGFAALGGAMLMVRHVKPLDISCQTKFGNQEGSTYTLRNYDRLTNIDELSLRRSGVVYAIAVDEDGEKQTLVKISYPVTRD